MAGILYSKLKTATMQLFFGAFFVATGGWLTAEPQLSLVRQPDSTIDCYYSFNAYGRFPVIRWTLEDFKEYEISSSTSQVKSGSRSSSGVSPVYQESSNLILISKSGDTKAIGNIFDLHVLDSFLKGNENNREHVLKIYANSWRKYGGILAGCIGVFILSGALWTLCFLPLNRTAIRK